MATAPRSSDNTGRSAPFDGVLDFFAAAPGVGVSVLDPGGRILFVNEEAGRLYLGLTPAQIIGKTLAELFPAEWVAQRMDVIRRATESGQAVITRTLWRGRQIESVTRRFIGAEGEPPTLLVITREGQSRRVPEGAIVVESETVDLGPLDALTPRELEVLALIGQGLAAKEIAGVLDCSPRTVERHRDALGKKLNVDDRVRLAMVAREAGLELRDAKLKRVRSDASHER